MRRPIIALLVGIIAGYFLGFFDAYRGGGTLGAHMYDLMEKIHPDNVAKARQQETAKFRDQIQQAAQVVDSAAQKPDST